MPDGAEQPFRSRLVQYFMAIEDEELRSLVAELVAIKAEYLHNANRPMGRYKEKIDAYASLHDSEA